MTKLLAKAGIGKAVLGTAPEAIDTFTVCRTGARPLPCAQATVELADKFNEQKRTRPNVCTVALSLIWSTVLTDGTTECRTYFGCTIWQHAIVVTAKTSDKRILRLRQSVRHP
jgi:hypothetical protein